jgi:DNA (cytosine-5)-methyltransferase 1
LVERQVVRNSSLPAPPTFVDAFAGCGGLSLGLKRSGWRGLLAIEKDPFAFKTLDSNFGLHSALDYEWPPGIERKPWNIHELLKERRTALEALSDKVDLLAGGPPCQGFSHAGRRNANDPRNMLFSDYLDLVAILRPKTVLLENVRGFQTSFETPQEDGIENFSVELQRRLSDSYDIVASVIKASDFGVPQVRPRFFLIGVRKELNLGVRLDEFFGTLRAQRDTFLAARGLPRAPSARDAISDLEISWSGRVSSPDSYGFDAIGYAGPRSGFQFAMRDEAEGPPSDTRLARHAPHIVERFSSIMRECREDGRLNTTISAAMRQRYGLKKLALRVMDPLGPSPTITSLPDDLLHYSEPRTLTVRENARLQTFPDWFKFEGKYTTGGNRRRHEVPRFTQVANAVPPLLAEQIGLTLLSILLDQAGVKGAKFRTEGVERGSMVA